MNMMHRIAKVGALVILGFIVAGCCFSPWGERGGRRGGYYSEGVQSHDYALSTQQVRAAS